MTKFLWQRFIFLQLCLYDCTIFQHEKFTFSLYLLSRNAISIQTDSIIEYSVNKIEGDKDNNRNRGDEGIRL